MRCSACKTVFREAMSSLILVSKVVFRVATSASKLEALVKLLTMECDTLIVSTVKKSSFREKIASLLKKVVTFQKQRMANTTEEIKAKAIAAGEVTEGNKVIFRFDFGANTKL